MPDLLAYACNVPSRADTTLIRFLFILLIKLYYIGQNLVHFLTETL